MLDETKYLWRQPLSFLSRLLHQTVTQNQEMGYNHAPADTDPWCKKRKWPWTDKNLQVTQEDNNKNKIVKIEMTYAVCEWAALAS